MGEDKSMSINIETVKQKQNEMLEKLAENKQFQRPTKNKSRPFYSAVYYLANIEVGRFITQAKVADFFMTTETSTRKWTRQIDEALGIDTNKRRRFSRSRGKQKQRTEKKTVKCSRCDGTGKITVEIPVGEKPENPDYYDWNGDLEKAFLQGLVAVGQTIKINEQSFKLLPQGWKQANRQEKIVAEVETVRIKTISQLPKGWKIDEIPTKIRNIFGYTEYLDSKSYELGYPGDREARMGTPKFDPKVAKNVSIVHLQITPAAFGDKQRFVVVTGSGYPCYEKNIRQIGQFDFDQTNWKEAMQQTNAKTLEFMQKSKQPFFSLGADIKSTME